MKSKNYGAPHYEIFSSLLSIHPSQVQIFSSEPCSQNTFNRPPIFPLNLTYFANSIATVFKKPGLSRHSKFQISYPFSVASFQKIRLRQGPCVTFRNMLFTGRSCYPPPNPQSGGPLHLIFSDLIILIIFDE
jgi:hypothetical protein